EAEALGEARGADVHAEALFDLAPATERELRAAAAGVEHDERARRVAEIRGRSEIREPSFLLAGDDLDLDAGVVAHGLEEVRAVGGDPQARGPDRGDLVDAVALRLVDHRPDRGGGPLHRLLAQPARPVEALAEPRHLGAVRDRRPRAVRAPLADVELDRV